MRQARFVRLVPAIRTVHGVEYFDYALPADHGFAIGDIVRFPFRRQSIEGMITAFLDASPFEAKIRSLDAQIPLLRLGETAVRFLQQTAWQTMTPQPSVLSAWLRTIPKRAKGIAQAPRVPSQSTLSPNTLTHFSLDRWHDDQGLLAHISSASGPILVLTPWRHRAEQIAQLCHGVALHADITDTEAWHAIQYFCSTDTAIVVATRIGAWLSCVAQTILIDEPEHDDHKQDEASPRYDARWMAAVAKSQRPEIALHAFSTTPRLQRDPIPSSIPTIEPLPILDPWISGHRADHIPVLTESSISELEEAIHQRKPAIIVHPTEGLHGRICCRDCGWAAKCDACGFSVTHMSHGAECRRCGKKSSIPDACPQCGGMDLSRGRIGRDLLDILCTKHFGEGKVIVTSPIGLESININGGCVVITDVQGLSGVVEDIRRKERLAINLRRLAARCAVENARLIWHGTIDSVQECSDWLSAEGLQRLWNTERAERALFSYPPMAKLIKVIVDGSDAEVRAFHQKLKLSLDAHWFIRGPYLIPFRAKQRTPRQIIHLIAPPQLSISSILQTLQPFASQAIFDLDPVSFFC